MSNWDKEYLKLCKKILEEGKEVVNRTGINTIKIPSYYFNFDLEKEFPFLTTKELFYKNAIKEMLWIYKAKSNDVRWLQERNVHIWDEWEIDEDGIYRIYYPEKSDENFNEEVPVYFNTGVIGIDGKDILEKMYYDENGIYKESEKPENAKELMASSLKNGRKLKFARYFGKEYAHTIGTAYGFITNRYGYTEELIHTIKNMPTDRRMVYSLWQNEFLRTAVLPSCVWSTEWNVWGDTLNLQVHQRSCDVPLGLPFNITQYATFLKMIAQVTDLEPGIISYSINEPHIYVNQLDGIKEQLRRADTYEYLKDKSELELLCEMRGNLMQMKHLDKKSKEYEILDSNNKIIDIILEPKKADLILNPNVTDFFDFDNSRDLSDIKVTNYKHMGRIKMPIAQ